MSILILNRYRNDLAPYIDWLAELDEPIVMIAEENKRPYLDDRYDKRICFPDWNTNGMIEQTAIELHKEYRFRVLLAFHETDIIRAAYLREYLGIPGQWIASALAYRNKMIMKRHLREWGLTVPEFSEITSPVDLIAFREKQGLPLVHKPVDGMGSMNTTIVRNHDDFEKLIANLPAQGYEVETFIDGDMYHVDGYLENEQLKFAAVSKYVYPGTLAFKDGGYLGSYILRPGDWRSKRLLVYTQEVIKALPPSPGMAFHAELFLTRDGEVIFCEIASRPGGGKIIQTLEYMYGTNILRSAVRLQCGLSSDKVTEPLKGHAGFLLVAPQAGVLKKLPEDLPLEGIVEYQYSAKEGDIYPEGPKLSVDHYLSAVVASSSESELIERMNETVDWVRKNTEWKEWNEANEVLIPR